MRRSSVARTLALMVALAAAALANPAAANDAARQRIDAYLAAFNQHSPDAVAALLHQDVELFYVDDTGQASAASSGRDAVRTELVGYFAGLPDVRAEIEGEVVSGERFISYRERVRWTVKSDSGEVERAQTSLTVMEIGDDSIRRVWYFPAE